MLECVFMPLPLRFVPRASCLSSAYLLSVYEDCDWFCMAWRAGSGNRCCLPSCNGFEMDMHCIIDSSSGSLRRSLCVSFVVVCEDCVVSLLCWVRSVCFPSCLALRVCPCVLGCWVPVQPSRKGGRRFPVSLLLLDAVCYDEQLLLRDTHPQRAPCREKDESVLSLYIAIYRPNL